MASPTLKDYRETYYAASAKAGDLARQLAFAGIALIWIFQRTAKDANDLYNLPEELYRPALFIVVTLTFDLLQYCYKSAMWSYIQSRIEKLYGPDLTKSYTVQEFLNWPTIFLFWGKISTIVVAYLLLFSFVLGHIKFSHAATNTTVVSKVQERSVGTPNIDKDGSATSLRNNVTITFPDDKSKSSLDTPTKIEPTPSSGASTLQNNVTITLPAITRTIVKTIMPEKKKDPCSPCEELKHRESKD